MANWPSWSEIEAVVQNDRYMGANDEFTQLRNKVMRSSPEEIDGESSRGEIVFEFLIGFAAKKNMYRSQIVQVIHKLLEVPSWLAVYSAHPELSEKVAQLHEDLQTAFESPGGEEPCGPVENWPELEVLADIVSQDRYMGANDEFNALKTKLLHATPAEIAAHADQAPTTWEFIINFAVVKPIFRSYIVQLIQKLADVPAWMAAFKTSAPMLREKTQELHEDVRAALGEEVPEEAPQKTIRTDDLVAAATPIQQQHPLLKRVQPYLKRAAELDDDQPIIAHYCRVYALETLVMARQTGESNTELDALMMQTFNVAEACKQRLDLSNGPATMEAFARAAFENADVADRSGKVDGRIPSQFYIASLFIEALAQFHNRVLPPDLAELSRYAKQRAVHVRECLQRGIDPTPPPPRAAGIAKQPLVPAPVPVPAPIQSIAAAPEQADAGGYPASATTAAPVAKAPAPDPPAAFSSAPAPALAAASAAAATTAALTTALGASKTKSVSGRIQGIARKRAELAAKSLEHGDVKEGRKLILETIDLLEGRTVE